jgi:hypothetical protein
VTRHKAQSMEGRKKKMMMMIYSAGTFVWMCIPVKEKIKQDTKISRALSSYPEFS